MAAKLCVNGLNAEKNGERSKHMPTRIKSLASLGIVLTAGLSLSGCATEDYVNKQIATVNERINGVEAKVQQVDQTAQQANASAQQANQRIDQLTTRVDTIEQQVAQKRPRN